MLKMPSLLSYSIAISALVGLTSADCCNAPYEFSTMPWLLTKVLPANWKMCYDGFQYNAPGDGCVIGTCNIFGCNCDSCRTGTACTAQCEADKGKCYQTGTVESCYEPWFQCMTNCGKTSPDPRGKNSKRFVRERDNTCDSTCTEIIALLDVNGDDLISRAEYQAWALGEVQKLVNSQYYLYANGTIDLAEQLDGYMELFVKADINGDGFLNVTEAWAPVSY